MMDREGIRSKRNDNGNETVMEFTSTGNSSEVLATSANEVGRGSRKIKSPSSKDAQVQSILTPGEQRNDEAEGGDTKSSGRLDSKNEEGKQVTGEGKKDGFGEKRGAMMVVSVLIATLTYQAALNPPGGFWQDDKEGHEAGTAINCKHKQFQYFMTANTVGLFASLVIILLLTSAITIKQQSMMWLLMFIMWVSVFSVAFSFFSGASIILRRGEEPAGNFLALFVLCCFALFALLVILHTVVGLKKMYGWLKKKRD